MERTGSSAKVKPAMAAGAWLVLWDAADFEGVDVLVLVGALVGGLVAALVGDLATGFALVFPVGTTFLGGAPAFFFAGLTPDPPLGFVLVVSRETSGIKAPKPRPRLCRFAITLTLPLTFGDFSRCC